MERMMPFGTVERISLVRPPQRGAQSTPQGWAVDKIFLNGEGYVDRSFNSRKAYEFQWPRSSTPQEAQEMLAYASGTYGRGKIYFTLPTIYHTNVLSFKWADPSIVCDFEAPPHRRGLVPVRVTTAGAANRDLPRYGVRYAVDTLARNFPGVEESMFIPIIPGQNNAELIVWAHYSFTGDAGLWWVRVGADGNSIGTPARVTNISNSSSAAFTIPLTPGANNATGIAIFLGRSGSAVTGSTITLYGMRAMISTPKNRPQILREMDNYKWIAGQGNNGCKFATMPTYITHGPINGGNVEFGASLREVM